MIGGCDNDISCQYDHEAIVNDFLTLIANHWPLAEFHVTNDIANTETFASKQSLPITVDFEEGTVTVCRDSRMKKHLEQFGVSLMADGEGPIVLFFWQRTTGCDFDLVTPALPDENPFSKWAVNQLETACKRDRELSP